MNKKGFTTVELILTVVVVMTIMATITSVTYNYRDRSNLETVITDINDYKNTVTKIIYDDILSINSSNGRVIKLEKESNNDRKYKLITETNHEYNLEIIDELDKKGIRYDNIEYIVPGSSNSLVTFDGVSMYPIDDNESNIYSLDIYFKHKNLKDRVKIHFIISNYS